MTAPVPAPYLYKSSLYFINNQFYLLCGTVKKNNPLKKRILTFSLLICIYLLYKLCINLEWYTAGMALGICVISAITICAIYLYRRDGTIAGIGQYVIDILVPEKKTIVLMHASTFVEALNQDPQKSPSEVYTALRDTYSRQLHGSFLKQNPEDRTQDGICAIFRGYINFRPIELHQMTDTKKWKIVKE